MSETRIGEIERKFNGEFGRLLRERRKQQRFTQQALAIEVGVSRNTICRWETGVEAVTVWRLLRLADILCCAHLWLLPGKSFTWGPDLERLKRERDPQTVCWKPVQAERDAKFKGNERIA